MIKVKNHRTLRLIASRFMRTNRKRNILAVIAIILTTMLFTTLFVGIGSLLLSNQATLIKQTMSSSHVIAQDLGDEDVMRAEECLKKNQNVERYGSGIFLGAIVNENFPFSAELRSGDANYIESFNCQLEMGRLPEQQNEIAVSSLILDACGIPQKLGATITIKWEQNPHNSTLITDTFTVTGIWTGDKAVLSQLAFVSPQYAEQNRHFPSDEELTTGDASGAWDLSVWYKNLYQIGEKTDELNDAVQFSSASSEFIVSPAFDYGGEDSFSIVPVIVFTMAIILAGYLIIDNIFSLSVQTDLKVYGLLKNIGTTGRQLQTIVRMQALRLSAIGIPIGLLSGYIAGKLMAPLLSDNMEISASAVQASEVVVAAHPFIFVVSALIALFTVYISSLKSCRMVNQVSPIEALKIEEMDSSSKRNKSTKSVSWYSMAINNIKRHFKKGIMVMISIALSLVVINIIYMLVTGYDFKEYQRIFLASDFQIDKMTSYFPTTNFNGVTTEVRELMDACEDAESTGYVYYSDERHQMEPHLVNVMNDMAEQYSDSWNDYEKDLWEEVKSTNEMSVHYLGITETVFDQLEWADQPCSWDDFKTGKYVITDYPDKSKKDTLSYYEVGDTLQMTLRNGTEREYTVLGEALMPYSLDYPYADIFFLTILVPEEEYIDATGNDGAMYGIMNAKDGKLEEVDQYMRESISVKDGLLNVFSVLDMQKSFQNYINKYYTIGAFLVIVLTFIGIMNFYNMMATTVISRKRELTLLEIVGMTRKQVIKMLVAEGVLYLAGAFLLAVLIVYLGAKTLIANTVGMAFFYHAETTIMPCILMLPFLLLIAVMIPYFQYKKLEKESLVERIRMS